MNEAMNETANEAMNEADAKAAGGNNVESIGMRPGGQILADALAVHGVDTIFGVPGESYLAVLDGLYGYRDRIRFVICRQEGGASFMADAYGKLTGKPGVLMVTRGPGATNGSIGVHSAFQDSVPMVVFIGQVGTDCLDREAFQEIDYRRMFGQMTKWVAQIDRVDRIPEYVAHAFQVATSGRMGPVVLALPEDMLVQQASVADARPHWPVQASPSPAQLETFRVLLSAARRPLVMLGGTGWTREACADVRSFIEGNHLPVSCAFRYQDVYDNRLPNYVGDVGIGINPKLAARVRDADLLIAIGPRLGEMTTSGYTLLSVPCPSMRLVHVHAGVDELGTVYQGDLMIAAGMPQIAAALRDLRVDSTAWAASVSEARAQYEAWQQEPPLYSAGGVAADAPRPSETSIAPKRGKDGEGKDDTGKAAQGKTRSKAKAKAGRAVDALNLWEVVQTIKRLAPADTIITNGAGNFATWAHRFWPYAGLRTQLSTTSGAMGYGVPAAVCAAITTPERTVVCFAGDGDFLMNAQELATAVQYGGSPIVIVFNNGMYGTIRMHQERDYPSRVLGTQLSNPDFARFIESFGGFGVKVQKTEEFAKAFRAALKFTRKNKGPALVELAVDPEAITPNLSLTQISGSKA